MKSAHIFRHDAIKNYLQNRERVIFPRFVPFPIIFCLWILLGLLLILVGLAWCEEIPTYETGPGIILSSASTLQGASHGSIAVIFLPADQAAKFHVGQRITVNIGSRGIESHGQIEVIKPAIMSPLVVMQQYKIAPGLVSQPSIIALASLKDVSMVTYAGSTLTARVETGTQRMITLFPVPVPYSQSGS